mgnify:CR=1 FL=1
MLAEGFFRRKAVGTLSFDFSDEKFMFKRTWQVVFWGTRNDSGVPKQLAARLKARDGLHSKVVAPESGRRGTKNEKMTAVTYRLPLKKWPLLKKKTSFIRVSNLPQPVFLHLPVQCRGIYFQQPCSLFAVPVTYLQGFDDGCSSVFSSFSGNLKDGFSTFSKL